MKKYVKLALCGLAAVMLIAGCSKKEETKETTAAAETSASAETETSAPAEEVDLGSVTKLGEYKGVEVEKMDTTVTDEDVEVRIETILASNPEYVEVTDRPAKEGDVVNIDYVGMKDGVAFDGGTAEGYDLELGSGSFIDGFEDGLIGAAVGSELSLNLTFPDPYQNADLAGQDVVFDVTVNSIEEKKEAVLDENFVQRVSDFTSVEDYKADVRAALEKELEETAEFQVENDAFMAVLENSEFELNQDAVQQQVDAQYSYYNNMMQLFGGQVTLDQYIEAQGMSKEEFDQEIRNAAETSIKQKLLVDAVAEAENMKLEDADREEIAAQYGMDVAGMQASYGAEAVDSMAMLFKVAAFIKDHAVIK